MNSFIELFGEKFKAKGGLGPPGPVLFEAAEKGPPRRETLESTCNAPKWIPPFTE
jgi:hypothetical protein